MVISSPSLGTLVLVPNSHYLILKFASYLFMKAAMYQTILNFTVTMSVFSQPMLKYTRVQVRLQAYIE